MLEDCHHGSVITSVDYGELQAMGILKEAG